jgi:lactoylglutathione lyase
MKVEHIAIWTTRLEELKDYYSMYFGGVPNKKYINKQKDFRSYFLSFKSGARIEIMSRPDVPENINDTVKAQHLGLIHIAFGFDTIKEVDEKANQLIEDGFQILSGPRITGDGYNEFETLDPDNNRIEVTAKYYE